MSGCHKSTHNKGGSNIKEELSTFTKQQNIWIQGGLKCFSKMSFPPGNTLNHEKQFFFHFRILSWNLINNSKTVSSPTSDSLGNMTVFQPCRDKEDLVEFWINEFLDRIVVTVVPKENPGKKMGGFNTKISATDASISQNCVCFFNAYKRTLLDITLTIQEQFRSSLCIKYTHYYDHQKFTIYIRKSQYPSLLSESSIWRQWASDQTLKWSEDGKSTSMPSHCYSASDLMF